MTSPCLTAGPWQTARTRWPDRPGLCAKRKTKRRGSAIFVKKGGLKHRRPHLRLTFKHNREILAKETLCGLRLSMGNNGTRSGIIPWSIPFPGTAILWLSTKKSQTVHNRIFALARRAHKALKVSTYESRLHLIFCQCFITHQDLRCWSGAQAQQ